LIFYNSSRIETFTIKRENTNKAEEEEDINRNLIKNIQIKISIKKISSSSSNIIHNMTNRINNHQFLINHNIFQGN